MVLTDEQKEQALNSLMRSAPIVGVYAETGTGKTVFTSTLMQDPRYRKVLFIDADRGGATIQHLTGQADLCEYRFPEKVIGAHALQQWVLRQLAQAHAEKDVGAIVVEGIARLYEDAVGEAFANASESDLVGHRLRRLYIVPSNMVKAVLTAIGTLQQRLVANGRAVPIVFTCNTKERTDDDGSKVWQVPSLSDSAVKLIMARSDAFMQLTRRGNSTQLLTDRDIRTTHRKVRGEAAAPAIAALRNPTLPQVFETWAEATANHAAQVHQHLTTQPQQ